MTAPPTLQPGQTIMPNVTPNHPPLSPLLYDDLFFEYIEDGVLSSSAVIVPLLRDLISPSSVLDVGCGRGLWLEAWSRCGVGDVAGVDWAMAPPDKRVLPSGSICTVNVAQPFDMGRRYELVMCLEVAEHIPRLSTGTLIANLVRHGDIVLFSAAPPGQGGHGHVNERSQTFWRDQFAAHGYRAFDPVRLAVRHCPQVAPWYRFNTLLFARNPPATWNAPAYAPLPEHSPVPSAGAWWWRLRLAMLRRFPEPMVTRAARWKNRLLGRWEGRH